MNASWTSSVVALITLIIGPYAFSADTASPSTRPAAPVIGEVQVQSLQGYTYVYLSSPATLNTITDTIDKLMPKLDAAIDAGAIRSMGPVVFAYHGATGERDKPFTLDVGIMVKAGSMKPDGFEMRDVPQFRCASVLYTGSVATLPQGFGKLYGYIGQQGLQPTDVSREVYLYWEGRESTNNIIQIQAELAQK